MDSNKIIPYVEKPTSTLPTGHIVKPGVVEVRNFSNPFDFRSSELSVKEYRPGMTLYEYLDGMELNGRMIIVNGRAFTPEEAKTYIPVPNSEVGVKPDVGKSFFTALLMIAVVVLAVVLPVLLPAAFVAAHATLVSLMQFGILFGGQLLVNAIAKPGAANQLGNGKDESPTYSWSPQTTAAQGIAIQKGYGRFYEPGNIVASYTSAFGQDMYLYVLISYGHGRADSIDDILINDNPISNYTGVQIERRFGYLDQKTVPWFNDIVNEFPQSRLVASAASQTFTGIRNDTQAIEVEIVCPKGLYNTDKKNGNILQTSVTWHADFAVSGSGTFEPLIGPRTTADVPPGTRWVAVITDQIGDNPTAQVNAAATSLVDNHFDGEPFDQDQALPVFSSRVGITGTYIRRMRGVWRPVDDVTAPNATIDGVPVATVTDWTDAKTVSNTVFGSTRQATRATIRVDNLNPGQYDIRVTKATADGDGTYLVNEIWVDAIREIAKDDINFGGQILLGIKAKATDQLSGAGLNVSARVTHSVPETAGYKNLIAGDLPKLLYRFNDFDTSSCFDASGRGNAGAYSGTVVVQKPTIVRGSPAKTATFAPGAKVTPAVSVATPTNWTVECWFNKPTITGGDGIILAFGDTASVALGQSGPLVFFGGTWHGPYGTMVAGRNYVCFRCKDGTLNVYLNNQLVGSVGGVPTSVTWASFADNSGAVNGTTWNLQALAVYDQPLRLGRIGARWLWGLSKHNALEDYTGDNPAIVDFDLATNPWYGGGADFSAMDVDRYIELAERCNEIVSDGKGGEIFRHTFNGLFDTKGGSVWDARLKVCTMCRAVPMRIGAKYSIVLDSPKPVSQIFGIGNMKKGTFKQTYIANLDRANEFDITFNDEANRNQRTELTVQMPWADGQRPKPTSAIDLFGITNEARAVREAQYYGYSNLYNTFFCEWDSPVEAIHCMPGDRVLVASDAVQAGESGRLVDQGDASNLLLDRKVTMVNDGTAYTVTVRLSQVTKATATIVDIEDVTVYLDALSVDSATRLITATTDAKITGFGSGFVVVDDATGLNVGDPVTVYDTDVIETRDVIPNYTAPTDKIVVSLPFSSVPEADDVYIFGGSTQPFDCHVLDISKSGDAECSIKAIVYNEQIYNDVDPVVSIGRTGYNVFGPVRPTSAVDNASDGALTWTDPANATIPDALYAVVTSTVTNANQDSHDLDLTNFGMALEPRDILVGVEIQIQRQTQPAAGGFVRDSAVQLIKNGAVIGSNKATGVNWTAGSEQTVTYGGPTDLWGLTSLAPQDVNLPAFGIRLRETVFTATGQPLTIGKINAVRVTYYVSRAADAAVSNLTAFRTARVENNIVRNDISLGWTPGRTTATVALFLSADGGPEVAVPPSVLSRTGASFTYIGNADVIVVRVVGVDGHGMRAPHISAPTATLNIGSDALPPVVNNFRYTSWNHATANLNLAWDAPTVAVDEFILTFQKLGAGVDWNSSAFVTSIAGNLTSVALSGVLYMGAGHYYLKARNSAGFSDVFADCKVGNEGLFYPDGTPMDGGHGSLAGVANDGLTYTSTTSSITIAWNFPIYRADGTATAINSSILVTGLTAGTSYKCFPYYDEASQSVGFVNIGPDNVGSTNAILYATTITADRQRQLLQQQRLFSRIPLSQTFMTVSTTSTGVGGGGDPGDGGCLHEGTLVRDRVKGVIRIEDVEIGDQIWGRNDTWLKVIFKSIRPHSRWIDFDFANGVKGLRVTSGHPWTLWDDSYVRSNEMTIEHMVITPHGPSYPDCIRYKECKGRKVILSLESPHTFFASTDGVSWVLTHNFIMGTQ